MTSRDKRTTDSTNEARGETNLKLEAQKIKDFTGGHEEWQKWKSRTECAFSGSGYERILADEEYAIAHERLNTNGKGRRKKGVTFGISDADHADQDDA